MRGDPVGRSVVGAQYGHFGLLAVTRGDSERACLLVLATVGFDLPRLHADALAAGGPLGQSLVEEAVDGVGVQPCRSGLSRTAVLGDHRVPLTDAVPVTGVETEGVGVGAQDCGAAPDVGRGVALQLGGRKVGQLGRLLQRPALRVADEVHHPVAAGRAGLARVAVEVGLAVADGDQEIARDVELLTRGGEGVVHGGAVGRGGTRAAGQGERDRDECGGQESGAGSQLSATGQGFPLR
ncbi:hypothetical protein RGQ21_18440 [Kitasatospora aureofaciens]|nr:hypothetical protein RGQ21_18440 [Kitasatospora aureofaciens]